MGLFDFIVFPLFDGVIIDTICQYGELTGNKDYSVDSAFMCICNLSENPLIIELPYNQSSFFVPSSQQRPAVPTEAHRYSSRLLLQIKYHFCRLKIHHRNTTIRESHSNNISNRRNLNSRDLRTSPPDILKHKHPPTGHNIPKFHLLPAINHHLINIRLRMHNPLNLPPNINGLRLCITLSLHIQHSNLLSLSYHQSIAHLQHRCFNIFANILKQPLFDNMVILHIHNLML